MPWWDPDKLPDRFLNRLAKNKNSTAGVYARMAKALNNPRGESGVRLTPYEIKLIFSDDAVASALEQAVDHEEMNEALERQSKQMESETP